MRERAVRFSIHLEHINYIDLCNKSFGVVEYEIVLDFQFLFLTAWMPDLWYANANNILTLRQKKKRKSLAPLLSIAIQMGWIDKDIFAFFCIGINVKWFNNLCPSQMAKFLSLFQQKEEKTNSHKMKRILSIRFQIEMEKNKWKIP